MSFPVSTIPGGGNGDTLTLASLPSFRAGWGGWQLTGPFLVLRPSRRAGGDGGQGTTLTHDNRSYVLSQKIPKL
jgi:hypothetical protein